MPCSTIATTSAGTPVASRSSAPAPVQSASAMRIAKRLGGVASLGIISAPAMPTAVGRADQIPASSGAMPPVRSISGSQLASA